MIGKQMGVYEKYLKRLHDFLLSLLAIIFLSPLIIVVAVLVRCKIGSPILFTQKRPGLNGKIFNMYKFRSMTNDLDPFGELLSDEQRITKFGKWLRASSLDELPELVNIVKGEMAIVGPRPLLVQYLEIYNSHQLRRHEVRPGLTGLAQVSGRNAISWEKKFVLDVKYVDSISLLYDWKIIFLTVIKVFKKEGITSKEEVTIEPFRGNK